MASTQMAARQWVWFLVLLAFSHPVAVLAQAPGEFGPFGEFEEAGEEVEEEAEELETDRDSFTPATTTVGDRTLVVESAWSYIDNRHVADTNSLPELVVRYGVHDWIELRLGWNWEAGGEESAISSGGIDAEGPPGVVEGDGVEEESQLSYGLKAGLTSQSGWRPQSAAIVQAATPTSGREAATELVVTYVLGWRLDNRWRWDSSIRYAFSSPGEEEINIWAPSSVLKIPLGESWMIHGEYFGIFSQQTEHDREQHYFSPGVHYLLNSDCEIGVRVGWGLNDESANFFTNVGAALRF